MPPPRSRIRLRVATDAERSEQEAPDGNYVRTVRRSSANLDTASVQPRTTATAIRAGSVAVNARGNYGLRPNGPVEWRQLDTVGAQRPCDRLGDPVCAGCVAVDAEGGRLHGDLGTVPRDHLSRPGHP